MGNGIQGHKDTAFWGKQKNFNLFSFPESLDVEADLFGLAGSDGGLGMLGAQIMGSWTERRRGLGDGIAR